jgi:hypothetical protein
VWCTLLGSVVLGFGFRFYLLGGQLVVHVVQPTMPLGGNRGRIVVHVLRARVVYDPPEVETEFLGREGETRETRG